MPKKPYEYKLRPAYRSPKLLFEMWVDSEDEDILPILSAVLAAVGAKPTGIHDLWMNDEVMLTFRRGESRVLLSKDVWGGTFIMTEGDQTIVAEIDQHMLEHEFFKKVDVDFAEYK